VTSSAKTLWTKGKGTWNQMLQKRNSQGNASCERGKENHLLVTSQNGARWEGGLAGEKTSLSA